MGLGLRCPNQGPGTGGGLGRSLVGTERGEKVTEGQTEMLGGRRLRGRAGRKAPESKEKGVNLGRGEAHGFGRDRAQTEPSFGR